jgi:asparagine synthase (glutamine-hydrolysing)
MVNFVAVVDADTNRRNSYIQKLKLLLSPVEGLLVNSLSYQDFSIIWAAGKWAPVSQEINRCGVALFFGDAIEKGSSKRIDAKENQQRWHNTQQSIPPAYDGFYAALTYDQNGILTCGADILGLFPLYYYSDNNTILVGSSPELFRYHPDFPMEFNPEGLVGILLIGGLFKGRTLLKGVKHLEAGNLLLWEHDKQPREIQQYVIPLSDKYYDLSIHEAIDVLDAMMDQAISRHTLSGSKFSLLLSGGLDSRMLAGYLHRNNVDFIATTEGLPTDIEMKCAINVATELGLSHIQFNNSPVNVELDAQRLVNLEHLACGFDFIPDFGIYNLLRKLAPRVISAYLCDAIVGGSHISWAYSKSRGTFSFEDFFGKASGMGISPDKLRKLLKKEIFADLVVDVQEEIRELYDSYSQVEFQKAWCFDLHHRQRYHVGGDVWRLSFGAWPVLPVVDGGVLEVMAGMPLSMLMNRRLEIELVCDRFPRLAALPRDQGTYFPAPVKASSIQNAKIFVGQFFTDNTRLKNYNLLSMVSRRLIGERLCWLRTMNFDNDAWKTLRNTVERNRNSLDYFFNRNALDALLPKPYINTHLSPNISGMKLLLAFSLWLKDHNLQSS